MPDWNYKYESYQHFEPTDRHNSNLRKGEYWTPDTEYAPHERNTSRVPSNTHDEPYIESIEKYEEGSHRLPIAYDRDIDRLIGRTIRAYRLVVDYERACPTGHRWIPEHIRMIKEAGRYLESDRVSLDGLRAVLAHGGDAVRVEQLRANAHDLRDYCWEILDLIKTHEKIPFIYGHAVGVQFRDPFTEADGIESDQQNGRRERSDTRRAS
ncbi:hypothetical protein SLS60_010281 [Paraconiothyrium brasiliense]|uniref:Uncharacterized protein n=1 Tax=Paraconiothyrium brasiliense TaxID=300254 RepID=A0ABR3QQU5_9PLEO